MATCRIKPVNETPQGPIPGAKLGRRAILAGIAAAPLAAAPALASAAAEHRALPLWRAWRAKHEECVRRSAQYRALAAEVPSFFRSPSVMVLARVCRSESDIDAVCDAAPTCLQPAVPEIRECAKRELQAIYRQAEAFEKQIGLTELSDRNDEAYNAESELILAIERVEGAEAVVIAAQLDLAVADFPGDHLMEDCPLWYLRLAMRNLLPQLPPDMAAAMQPIAHDAEHVRDVYWPQVEA